LEVLAQAPEAGLAVRALARNPARLQGELGAFQEVVQGDVTDPGSLASAMDGVDAVVSVLGTALSLGPVSLPSEGTRNLIQAMQAGGVSRLLCVTGMGAGDSRGHGGFLYDRLFLPLLLGRIYADKDRQEQVVRASGLDWVLVRPARLVEGPVTAAYRELTELQGQRLMTITRRDVAHFLLGEIQRHRYSRETVNLSD
jgi:putative NADH-flavin reductase